MIIFPAQTCIIGICYDLIDASMSTNVMLYSSHVDSLTSDGTMRHHLRSRSTFKGTTITAMVSVWVNLGQTLDFLCRVALFLCQRPINLR